MDGCDAHQPQNPETLQAHSTMIARSHRVRQAVILSARDERGVRVGTTTGEAIFEVGGWEAATPLGNPRTRAETL